MHLLFRRIDDIVCNEFEKVDWNALLVSVLELSLNRNFEGSLVGIGGSLYIWTRLNYLPLVNS
jgi:hypothetical protein